MIQYPKPHKPNKGLHGGACNREACQDEPAFWYNHGTQKFYCSRCARLINDNWSRMNPGQLLCVLRPKE